MVGETSDQAVSSKHFHHQMQFVFQFANLLPILLTFKEIPVQSKEAVLKNCIEISTFNISTTVICLTANSEN